jgi:hypothetical protein
MRNNGSAYPECNDTGVWKSVKQTQQMKDSRKIEIKKLRRQIVKFAAAAGHGRKKKRRSK